MKQLSVVTLLVPALCLFTTFASPPAHAEGSLRDSIRERVRERIVERQQAHQDAAVEAKAPEKRTIAGLEVAIWTPDTSSPGPWPLVIFSHAFRGCNTQSSFLMAALAAAGYVVVAPNHADAACGAGASRPRQTPEERFNDPASWTAATYRARGEDIRHLLDALKQDDGFAPHIDWSRVGLAGHSLGGYTVLGLGGAWPEWKLPEAKAVLALSPYCAPFADHGDLGGMGVPVMYQGGSRDIGITPSVKKPGGCYEKTAAPASFIELDKAGHFAWTDMLSIDHDNIVAYSRWFFDAYLKNDKVPLPAVNTGISTTLSK